MNKITSIKSVLDSKQFLAFVSIGLIVMMSVKVSLTQKIIEQSFSSSYELVQK